MKIAILGSGQAAQSLAKGFLGQGYNVVFGTGHPEKLEEFKDNSNRVETAAFKEAASQGELVVLAIKGLAAEEVVKSIEIELNNKIVIDATNPISDKPPVNGVLEFFTGRNESLMERLQSLAPKAKFVKAFNSIGSALMVSPELSEGRPSMFICGNDEEARVSVAGIVEKFGFTVEDMGKAEAARPIESLCILWCIPGFLTDSWRHGIKMIR
jgi:predicted dinucleotide-binding enzyme